MNHDTNKKGFTLIELMLAMGFVSALLLVIAMTVIQIGNIYNRGITLKAANESGRSIASELQRSINSSPIFSLDDNYVAQDLIGGRLCTGQYSYVWNYAEAINRGDVGEMNVYDGSTDQIRFIKVIDQSSKYCKNDVSGLPEISKSDATELLNVGDQSMSIHDFYISSNAYDGKTNQRIYNIRFLIGTSDMATINDGTCKPPSEAGSDLTYCAINEFNITARAGNKSE
ncbi:MAG: prepilin-type N-terminal cleavage/methylation domain-containing protein [Candidatus Saccharibacteria bacterium]